MACVLQIGAGGVGGVVAHKMAQNREVFSRIVLASRTLDKCKAIADSIRAKGLGEIEIDEVNADNAESLVALIEKYHPLLVVNVALPYQDLSIMEACLRTKTHYLDTANYEHPDSAHFEYKEQWAFDTRYKQAGIFALLGSGFDPGVTNVFCAYAQKHYFDEIESIDILDCNAGDHGYAFATNFNPEINLREVSSKARYWVNNSSLGNHSADFEGSQTSSLASPPKSPKNHESNTTNIRIVDSSVAKSACNPNQKNTETSLISNTDLKINPDLKQDTIYRKFEREEKHFSLDSNTQDLQVLDYAGGQWRDIPPLAMMKEWDYPEVGVKNSYLLYHEELESLVRNIKGLQRIRFFMTFGESYLTHMKCLENIGFLRIDEVSHKGSTIVPIEVLKTLLPDPASLASRTKGKTNIGCYIKGKKGGKERTIYIYNVCEHEKCYEEVNAQGVSYTTGVPAMIGAKLICEGKWGIGASKNASLAQSLNECCNSASVTTDKVVPSPHFAQHSNLTQDTSILDSDKATESFNKNRLAMNADMPKGGEYQGIDNGAKLYQVNGDSAQIAKEATQGSGVWNIEQNDPDPFMSELNIQGLPYVVLEIDSNGGLVVLEDGRKNTK
ncbi:saccharopine dehydrogenase family protein [Helicobacter muridarum]|uniref:Putative saccharopine dehydrogenase n=1 Tax=Helicobacter muridarum TaxID=216 RepID=A0A099TZ23_9HELI|nr:saccharopine dehydrogenase family protein [Helicobacter muridarum]TLD98784.1 saccharopine dehydrogenase family protein [Helicobacter muridarum]STQ85459.1 putative saccharopine dehydrogenase [Helicobacter muridarum]